MDQWAGQHALMTLSHRGMLTPEMVVQFLSATHAQVNGVWYMKQRCHERDALHWVRCEGRDRYPIENYSFTYNGVEHRWWRLFDQAQIPQYEEARCVPWVSAPPATPGVLNLFIPMPYASTNMDLPPVQPALIQPILEHLRILSDNNEANMRYQLGYLAHMLQRPTEKPGVMIVIQADAIGKDLFYWDFMSALLGEENCWRCGGAKELYAKYNEHMEGKIWTVVSCLHDGAHQGPGSCLERELERSEIIIKPKRRPAHNAQDYRRVIAFADMDKPVARGPHVVLIRVSADPREAAYFTRLVEIMSDSTVQRAFFAYLMAYNLNGFDVRDSAVASATDEL